jgi:integrase
VIRDMKDPRHKAGNDFTFPLLGEAWPIVQRQPRIDERIFPYNSKSAGARYTRAKKTLKIVDLRFHDLRRECASRLFEAGYQIHEVAQVTGHKDLNTLWKIYTKLNPEALHARARRRR